MLLSIMQPLILALYYSSKFSGLTLRFHTISKLFNKVAIFTSLKQYLKHILVLLRLHDLQNSDIYMGLAQCISNKFRKMASAETKLRLCKNFLV